METEVSYQREKLNPLADDFVRWLELFDAHAIELRDVRSCLATSQYMKMQDEGRLVIITARVDGILQGYSSHFWHRDLHFEHRVAQDDAWYVVPEFRNHGVGRKLREMALEELKKDGVKYAYGRLKVLHPHDTSMKELGYVPWETVFIKEL